MSLRIVTFGFLAGAVMMTPLLACDDLTLPAAPPDAGGGEGGAVNPSGTLPPYAPPSAVAGESVRAFGSDLVTWATIGADGKVDGVHWNLPLAANRIVEGTPFESRIWTKVPDEVVRDTAVTGFGWDWIPLGHIPKGVYDTPHWEFHIVFQDYEKVRAIDCSDMTMPPNELVPSGYFVIPPPDVCFPQMGLHAINLRAPEFNGARFTHSHFLVYYKGDIAKGTQATFVSYEPKVTAATLNERKTFAFDVPKIPAGALGRETRLPTSLIGNYDAVNDVYVFTLGNFVPAN